VAGAGAEAAVVQGGKRRGGCGHCEWRKYRSFFINHVCRGEGSRPVGQSIALATSIQTDRCGTDARGGALPYYICIRTCLSTSA
jgi:hypothetical protein